MSSSELTFCSYLDDNALPREGAPAASAACGKSGQVVHPANCEDIGIYEVDRFAGCTTCPDFPQAADAAGAPVQTVTHGMDNAGCRTAMVTCTLAGMNNLLTWTSPAGVTAPVVTAAMNMMMGTATCNNMGQWQSAGALVTAAACGVMGGGR